MDRYEIIFERLTEAKAEAVEEHVVRDDQENRDELEEIEELRRFSAELREAQPPSFTTT